MVGLVQRDVVRLADWDGSNTATGQRGLQVRTPVDEQGWTQGTFSPAASSMAASP